MKTTYIYLLFLFVVRLPVSGQRNLEKQVIHDRITLNSPDSTVVTYLWPSKEEIPVDEDKIYYWYKANQIRISRGGYGGELLHGNYTSYYIDQNLQQKGEFKKGLKVGSWKSWYPNGERKEVSIWKNGQRNGKFMIYRPNGTLYQSGEYKKDKIKGKVTTYDESGKKLSVPKATKKKSEATLKKEAKKDSLKTAKAAKLAKQKRAKKDSLNTKEKEMRPKKEGLNPLEKPKEKKSKKKKESAMLDKKENDFSFTTTGD